MPTFIVKKAEQTGVKQTDYGQKQTIALTLQEYGQAAETSAEWFTNATVPLPEGGSQIEGDVTPSPRPPYGLRFKKARPEGGGFRGGGKSPDESRSITRMHSQHMALLYAQVRQAQGKLPDGFSFDDLAKVTDLFDRDALEGWKPAS